MAPPQQQVPQQAPAEQQPAPAVAAAHMSAQQSAAALQQIAMGGGFAPALIQQQPMQQQQPGQQAQPLQYIVAQQPMQYAAAPGMQPGYAYVVQYPAPGGCCPVLCRAMLGGASLCPAGVDFGKRRTCCLPAGAALRPPLHPGSPAPAGMQHMPQAMPTYQPTYQPMEHTAPMPAAPLPPQSVKRPLTISAPDDASPPGGGSAAPAPAYHVQPQYQQYAAPPAQQHAPQVYSEAEVAAMAAGEVLQQRATAAPGARRYSAAARQGL